MIFSLTPQSMRATFKSEAPVSTWKGCFVQTCLTRLITPGSRNASSSSASYSSPTTIRARLDPRSRRNVTVARVSTAETAGMPDREHQDERDAQAVQYEYFVA